MDAILPMMATAQSAVSSFDQHWIFQFCAIFGTVAAAIGGATASCRVRMDIVGIITCGSVAALGGGTLRDLLLTGLCRADGTPITVYWVTAAEVKYLYYALGTSLATFYITRFVPPPVGTIRVADAFSMAFFTLIGVAKANNLGCPWVVSVSMGVCTGVAGGALRDLATGNVPYIFRPGELYAAAALVGAVAFIAMQAMGFSYPAAFITGTLLVFVTRMAAVYLNWELPSYMPIFESEQSSGSPKSGGFSAAALRCLRAFIPRHNGLRIPSPAGEQAGRTRGAEGSNAAAGDARTAAPAGDSPAADSPAVEGSPAAGETESGSAGGASAERQC